MSKTLIVQSFRDHDVPPWIARCLASVAAWSRQRGYDYVLVGDEAFDLCGPEYLADVGDNRRSITNLARLELVRRAHADGYDMATWVDADVFVFHPEAIALDRVNRYAFARETWVEWRGAGRWFAFSSVNNSVFACRRGEPDLDFLISATRHVARRRRIRSNYQVGGDLIKGLRASLDFETLGDVGMLSNYVVMALATGGRRLLQQQARLHGEPIHASNLCASENYSPRVGGGEAMAAMDALQRSAGDVINGWLEGRSGLGAGESVWFGSQDLQAWLEAGPSISGH